MGQSMVRHLLAAGHVVRVHTRTRDRATALLELGATWADDPRTAAEGSDIAISIVGYPRDVEEVHLGSKGTLHAARPPRYLIDMTTSSPALAIRIAAIAETRGVLALDAPVSGGDIGARNATLSIMVGGDQDAFDAVRPVLATLGKTIVRQGPAGAGQHTKMVNQILIAGTMMGVSEGLLYARKAGLDPATVVSSVGVGAAGSWTVDNLVPRILRGDFRPGFFIEHFVKDLGIALDAAHEMGLDLPAVALAKRLYEAAIADGYGRSGTQALFRSLAERAGEPVHIAP
jgi:3-hydroxyisobutyrate dehydrogenase